MDWSNVTAEDLIEALREVDWSSPPRPLSEFFSRFTAPRSISKWNSRLKCNLYYYRTNYFIMIVFILGLSFLRRPVSIVAAALTALSIAFLNDSFAGSFNEKATRTVRQFSPHLAAKMRPPLTPVIRGRPSAKRAIYVCGRPRSVFVFVSASVRDVQASIATYGSRIRPLETIALETEGRLRYPTLRDPAMREALRARLSIYTCVSYYLIEIESAASFILWFVSCGLLSVLWTLLIGLTATLLHASFRTPNLKARLNTFREEFRAVWRNYSEL